MLECLFCRQKTADEISEWDWSSDVCSSDLKLSKALQDAINRSDELYDKQKQFIGNASHELQTPLAVIGNRIDWMVEHWQLDESQMNELFLIRKELRALVRMNKTLLLLTKIDNQQFPDTVEVDLVELIVDVNQTYTEIYEHKNMKCHLSLPDSFIYKMNDTLANVLITNLLRNAYVHAPEDSEIDVSLKERVLIVSNVGDHPLDKTHIFNRFYQGGKKEGSTGLGLALVAAVADYYHLRIDYQFINQRHCFYVYW